MPIDYSKYPEDWPEIRKAILERAEDKCELCGAENHLSHPITGSKVVLTVHHIDHDITNNKPYNLMAACQKCHLRLDLPGKIKRRKQKTEEQAKAKTEPTPEQQAEYLQTKSVKRFGEELAAKIESYLLTNEGINGNEIEINVEIIRNSETPYELKAIATIYKKEEESIKMKLGGRE